MKKEIRKDIRDYILEQVNESLARLGVSEKVVEVREKESRSGEKVVYEFESAPIRQTPVMFRKLYIGGYMTAYESSDPNKHIEVSVRLDYWYDLFNGGSNGCSIGWIHFVYLEERLPESFESDFGDLAANYIIKRKGLEI